MIRVVPTGDLGLDVLLGGGWRLVKRFEDKESATVIVRGGSGAGKTLIGIQAALELSTALGGDVAVGCVEILPTEYVAQLQSARPSLPAARVAHLPDRAASDDGPRVYVGLLKLDGDEPDLVTALEQLEAAVREAGGNPTTFIVDSLIDGYGIGSSVDRIVADDVLRFSANYGHALVLCEEITSDVASPWVFAADTVLHVGVESRERGRWIEVKKHRFGPSATGPHELELVGGDGRPEIRPSPAAWRALAQAGFREAAKGPRLPPPRLRVGPNAVESRGKFDCNSHTVVCAATDERLARFIAMAIAPANDEWTYQRFIEIDPTTRNRESGVSPSATGQPLVVLRWPMHAAPATWLRWFMDELRAGPTNRPVCFVLGDLRHVLFTSDGERWLDAIEAATVVFRDVRPAWTLILYVGEIRGDDKVTQRLHRNAETLVSAHLTASEISASVVGRGSAGVAVHWNRGIEQSFDEAYLAARRGHTPGA